jgi:multicomponent K+:H+ antiporter subunit C
MSIEFLLASGIAVLTAAAVWLVLRARTFDVILGLTLMTYAVNLFLLASGRVMAGKPPIIRDGAAPLLSQYADPLPQALVLTAIVISMAMTALVLVLALQGRSLLGSDHVDGREPRR